MGIDEVETGAVADTGVAPEQLDAVAGLSLASRAVHADDGIAAHRAIAPAMHVSTTFRYNPDPSQLKSWDNVDVSALLLSPLTETGVEISIPLARTHR